MLVDSEFRTQANHNSLVSNPARSFFNVEQASDKTRLRNSKCHLRNKWGFVAHGSSGERTKAGIRYNDRQFRADKMGLGSAKPI